MEGICLADRIFQGMVALSPLRALHPVKDIGCIGNAPVIERLDSFCGDHLNAPRFSIYLLGDV
jgi:hypothetical protein